MTYWVQRIVLGSGEVVAERELQASSPHSALAMRELWSSPMRSRELVPHRPKAMRATRATNGMMSGGVRSTADSLLRICSKAHLLSFGIFAKMAEIRTPQLLPNNPGNHVFPLAYRLQGSGFWVCTLFGLVIVGAGLAAMRFALSHVSPFTVTEGPGALTLLIVCFPSIAVGAFFFVLPFFYRLILRENSIEENYVMWQKCFLLDEILGKKEYRASSTVFMRMVVIFPKNRRLRPMKLKMHFKDTTALDAWLSRVPDIEPTPNDWPKLPRFVSWIMPAFFMIPVLIRLLLLAYNHTIH